MRCWQAGPQQPTLQGSISCGDTVEGNTGDPGVSILGGRAVEHTYSFSVGWESSLNFDACSSDCKQHHQATLAPHPMHILEPACLTCLRLGVNAGTATLTSPVFWTMTPLRARMGTRCRTRWLRSTFGRRSAYHPWRLALDARHCLGSLPDDTWIRIYRADGVEVESCVRDLASNSNPPKPLQPSLTYSHAACNEVAASALLLGVKHCV